MARGDINEYQDPQTRRLIDSLIQQANKANNSSTLGGLASVLNQGMAGYHMGQDKRQRGASTAAMNKALAAKPWIDPNTAKTAGQIDEMDDFDRGDDYDPNEVVLEAQEAPGQLQGIDRAVAAMSQASEADPDNAYMGRDLRGMLTTKMGQDHAAKLADRAYADKVKFAQYQSNNPKSYTSRPASSIQEDLYIINKRKQFPDIDGKPSPEVQQAIRLMEKNTVVNLGGTQQPYNAMLPNSAQTPAMPVTLKPGETPEAKAAQAQATGSGSGIGKENQKQYWAVQDAFSQIEKIGELTRHLKTSDAITGIGADMLKNIERVKAFMGNKVAAGKASDTEILDVMMGSEVFPMIKALGVGARGMDTPAEREFMRSVLTGSIQLNKTTLITMAEIRSNVAKRSIERWNKRVGRGDLDNFFKNQGLKKKTYEIKEPAAPRDGTVTPDNPLGF